ncbi:MULTISPECIES: ABC transporter permease [unclassified Herbaspirillum]|uniref:ABC transporter permease n=1 Tax=unclassified Herbaspirillum TaxID=2624150 RepID=UPI00114D5BE6|nr:MULTISPECIES: ABC transporter permease [unclassified Herbaspirillum]MBB5391393.1 putative spermidine/putrescine transport system permease protein [Herbaspirillum sp. SJZ102]TQK12922.1 putative spermidine/putrescine transport system permease protein [Herbaspirillum sp. SJZ130]TQK14926.1 putative spermidine/putrescine transport system permease protein [Herbaspirillum sp. SJZ106]TWC67281.1 putative spermidine/putrescine transport system permease protein [Herbaspirillum sp. SJZ099]
MSLADKKGPGGTLFPWLLLTPSMLFLAAFLAVPGILLAALSLRNVDSMLMLLPTYGLAQYAQVFTSPHYLSALGTTLWVAALTAALCVLLAYPAAWLLVATRSRGWRTLLYVILISPLLTSVVIRTFAWIVLLAQNGLINDILRHTGLIDSPLALLWNMKAVIVAYVQVMLPFAVLPLATSLGDIPEALPRASQSLGAGPFHTFTRVILPLTIPGMMSGAIIVFALAAGSYVTPLLIGGRLQPLLPIGIYQQALQIANLPLAAALSLTLLAVTAGIAGVMTYLQKRWERRVYGH